MFKLSQSATFTWPVECQLPIDGGKFEKATFDAEFRRKTMSELSDMQEALKTDAEFVREIMTGWKGVTDDGAEVPFSEAALGQMLAIPGVSASIVLAYRAAIVGLKQKN
jgi:hypothetical protein